MLRMDGICRVYEGVRVVCFGHRYRVVFAFCLETGAISQCFYNMKTYETAGF